MSWLFRAIIGYVIGSFFRMPMLGMLFALYFNPWEQRGGRGRRYTWHFNNFTQDAFQEGRWVQGCFSSLGAFAKAGGSVTQSDIKFSEALMQGWHYSPAQREQAIEAFRYGRQEDPQRVLYRLSQSYYWTRTLQGRRLMEVIETYLQRKTATAQQRLLLQAWAQHFGSFGSYHQQSSQQGYQGHYQHQYQQRQRSDHSSSNADDGQDLNWAYTTLGATAQDDQATVKKKFRRAVAKAHPDRHANDPKATEKTQKIQKAYAMIKQAKGWK